MKCPFEWKTQELDELEEGGWRVDGVLKFNNCPHKPP